MNGAVPSPCDRGVAEGTPCVGDAPPRSRPWILAATILGSSMVFIDGTVVNVAVPKIQVQFNTSAAEVQWVVESYALAAFGAASGRRLARRPLRPPARFRDRRVSVRCRFAMVRARFGLRRARHRPCRAGCGRRIAGTGQSRHPERHISGVGAWTRDRHLVRLHRDHHGHGAGAGRLAHRSCVVALGVFSESSRWLRWCCGWRARTCPKAAIPSSTVASIGSARALATLALGLVVYALLESSSRGWSDAMVLGALGVGIASGFAFWYRGESMRRHRCCRCHCSARATSPVPICSRCFCTRRSAAACSSCRST